MSVTIFPQSYYSGSSGQDFANASTLARLGTDSNGNLAFNGKTVGSENSSEVAYSLLLSEKNISSCSIELPGDCDTSKSITLALQGIATINNLDWEVIEKDFPQLDLIAWRGLGLQSLVKAGDAVLITYYKKI